MHINSVEDFWKMVDECKAEGLGEFHPEMVRRIAQAIKDSNFPVNAIAEQLPKRTRTELLALAAEQGVTGFTKFN